MSGGGERRFRAIISGEDRSAGAIMMRGVLSMAEPFYAGLMWIRNRFYDWGLFPARRVEAAVISVGNITAGGTGKTPVVAWLAGRMRRLEWKPGVLLRGYKRSRAGLSDEEALLRELLGEDVPVKARPDRVRGAREVLAEKPGTNLLVLDDGFQHRRIARDFDLVLIDATEPFGHGHVHPRGLLREPMGGLRRADAFLMTRCDQVSEERRKEIEAELRSRNPAAPVYHGRHRHCGLRAAGGGEMALEGLAGQAYFAFAGIANPMGLQNQLAALPGRCAGHRWFSDHHDYSEQDLELLRLEAGEAGATALLTTEKDFVKLRAFAQGATMPVFRLQLQIELDERDEKGLLDLIQARLESARMK